MRAYKKLDVSEEYYKQIMNTQRQNGSVLKEHFIGSRKKMYSDNMFIATICENVALDKGSITDQQFYSFIGQFNKQLYKRFEENPALFDLDVEFRGSSRQKNYEAWDKKQAGDFFYNIDLSSAYWQMAYKLGYLNEKMFNRYLPLDNYKEVKRYVISFLSRTNKMRYYLDDQYYEICCDADFLKKVYSNIRYALYNYISDCISKTENWIEYNIDGVVVSNTDVDTVMNYFRENNLVFKMTECRKLNDYDYIYKNRVRNFKRRPTTNIKKS